MLIQNAKNLLIYVQGCEFYNVLYLAGLSRDIWIPCIQCSEMENLDAKLYTYGIFVFIRHVKHCLADRHLLGVYKFK